MKRLTELELDVVITLLESSLDAGWMGERAKAAERALKKLTVPKKPRAEKLDSRYEMFVDLIFRAHKHYVRTSTEPNVGVTPIFSAAAGQQLKELLKSCPNLNETQFRRWLKNYHQSENHNAYDSPSYYISSLPRYEGGPLNKFGRMNAAD
jgi:hypothetical protein